MGETQLTTGQPKARVAPPRQDVGVERELLERLGLGRPPVQQQRPSLRARIVEGFKTLLWVLSLTALLWVYAEREQLDKKEGVTASIQVQSSDPARRIVTIVGADHGVILDLAGPRASVERVRERLMTGAEKLHVAVTEEPDFNGEISLIERISKNEIFTRNAVTVTRATPSNLSIRVEAKVARELPVRPRPTDDFLGTCKFTPAKVIVTGPKSMLDRLLPDQQFVDADMSAFTDKKAGEHDAVVAVKAPFADPSDNFTVEPAKVTAKVEITASEPYTIPSLSVWATLPLGVVAADRYKIDGETRLNNVKVTGPKAAINDLKENRFEPSVVVRLAPEDLNAAGDKQIPVPIKGFILPEGVTVVEAPKTVTIKLVERN